MDIQFDQTKQIFGVKIDPTNNKCILRFVGEDKKIYSVEYDIRSTIELGSLGEVKIQPRFDGSFEITVNRNASNVKLLVNDIDGTTSQAFKKYEPAKGKLSKIKNFFNIILGGIPGMQEVIDTISDLDDIGGFIDYASQL